MRAIMHTHAPIIDGIGQPFYRRSVPRFFDGGLDRFGRLCVSGWSLHLNVAPRFYQRAEMT